MDSVPSPELLALFFTKDNLGRDLSRLARSEAPEDLRLISDVDVEFHVVRNGFWGPLYENTIKIKTQSETEMDALRAKQCLTTQAGKAWEILQCMSANADPENCNQCIRLPW